MKIEILNFAKTDWQCVETGFSFLLKFRM